MDSDFFGGGFLTPEQSRSDRERRRQPRQEREALSASKTVLQHTIDHAS
jgi:hypothetical protein